MVFKKGYSNIFFKFVKYKFIKRIINILVKTHKNKHIKLVKSENTT